MAGLAYFPEVECNVVVPDGLLNTQVIGVPDEDDRQHVIRLGKNGLVESTGKKYLRVGVVMVDSSRERVLVELPQEADSGVSRIWVPLSHFRRSEGFP